MLENKALMAIIRWLVILVMPFFLGLGTIRAIIAWDYPAFEYKRIEPDMFGFTDEQRLELAHGTLAYLQRPEPASQVIYMLEDLRLPGTDFPLYNPAEISHMIDVKVVADAMRNVVYVTGAIVLIGLATQLVPARTRPYGWRTVMMAGLATVIVLALIAVAILAFWDTFFVQFHELLFADGTWTFAYSDSLIRLFPEQFWFDIGVLISGTTLLLGVLMAVVGWVMSRRG
ncbi:MAG: TIGR01906 family membrane protein [Anaerolineae bacterium]|nr:TIGR01906 family membrane protein [Anaerolineae bacterium]